MSVSTLPQLERNIQKLSLQEQLRLLEWLVQMIRAHTVFNQTSVEDELAEMAADPEIQIEIRAIESEFAFAEADGLGAA